MNDNLIKNRSKELMHKFGDTEYVSVLPPISDLSSSITAIEKGLTESEYEQELEDILPINTETTKEKRIITFDKDGQQVEELFLIQQFALGLLGVIAVDAINIQKVDARGCNNGVAFNASKGRCFGH